MTINLSDNNPRANYTATSGQTAFTIPFDYFDDGDISVYQNGTLKTITTHYTISGSTVTLVTGATAGDKIAITRDVPLERTTDLTSTYNAASINNQLDTIVAQIADLDDRVSRSISLNDYEVGVSLDLPATADRLGKTIQFNSSTGALEVGPSGDELTSIASIASEITALDGISANITSVAGYLTEINNVGDNIASVTSVSGSISSVGTVSTNIADVNSVAGSITNLNDVADSLDQVELVATSISNVDIVGPAIANVNTVASNITNINTVSGISSNITTVAGITAAISTVNSNAADITSVSNNIDDVNDVANVIIKVTTVADNIANVNTVAPAVTYVSTLANNISNINILAPISADITAAAAVASDIGDAATNAAAAISAKTAAESARDATLAAFDSFDDRYLGAKAADPSVDNDGNALVGGALYYNTTDEVMKVYTGSAWVAAYASLSGALLVANNLSDLANAASARTNLGLGTAATTASTDYVAVTGDSMTGNLTFGDNNKAIFGAGSDLQIYHDGSDSYVTDQGTGNLRIMASNLRIGNAAQTANYILANDGGGVTLNHSGSSKLVTTSTGIDVTGTVTADGLTVDGDAVFSNGDNSILNGDDFAKIQLKSIDSSTNSTGIMSEIADVALANFDGASNNHELVIRTNNGLAATGTLKDRISIANNGDISFYEDTGTTAKFFWDASAERLGIGTSSPSAPLEVDGGSDIAFFDGTNVRLKIQNPSTGVLQLNSSGAGDSLSFATVDTERMRIDSSGRVGIGMSSPSSLLHLKGSTSKITLEDSDVAGATCIIQGGGAGNLTLAADPDDAVASSYITFQVDASEAMRIDSSGNVGIGYTTAAEKLGVNGFIGVVGTHTSPPSANPSISRVDQNNAMGFFNNSAERMRIDSSGNLLVGKTSSSASTTGAELQAGSGGQSALIATAAGTKVGVINRTTSDGDLLEFRKDGTTVGSIGTAGGDLLIYSSASNHVGLRFGEGYVLPTNNSGTASDAAADLGLSVNRFKDIYLSGGIEIENGLNNVGVGKNALRVNTGNYNTALGFNAGYSTVTGNNNTYIGVFSGENSTGSGNTFVGDSTGYLVTGSKNTILGRYNGNQGGLDIRTSNNNIVLSDGDGNPRVQVDSSGFTHLMGNVTSRSGNVRHEVYTADDVPVMDFRNSNANGGFGVDSLMVSAAPNNTSRRFFRGSDTSASRFIVYSNGNVVNTNNSYGAISDVKLKENIVDAASQWDDIKALTIRKYSMKADNLDAPNMLGVIAQEVEAANMGGLVFESPDLDPQTNEDLGTVTKQVNYSILYMKAVKALQEAMDRIETLEAKVTALENA